MMVDFVQRHRPSVVMTTLTAFCFLCMALRVSPYIAAIKTSLWFLISPEIVYTGQFFNRLDAVRGRVFGLVRAEGENQILREQNLQLSKSQAERDALEEENGRLRSLLGLRQSSFPSGVPAEVVGREARDWFQSFVIDKGSEDHVSPSAAVVTMRDDRLVLVGRTVDVREHTSKVLLLTDAVSAITVSVARVGDMGLLEGRSEPLVSVNYLPQRSEVAAGDEIVTAGMGGLFPAGIPVGRVESVALSANGFFREAKVRPYVRVGSVRDVLVVQRELLPAEAPPQ